MKKSVRLVSLGLCLISPCIAAQSVFDVRVLDDGAPKQAGVAALIAPETLIINNLLLEQGNQFLITDPQSGAKIYADVSGRSESHDLALLRVKGLKGDPVALASEPAQLGRKVSITNHKAEVLNGTLHSELPASQKQPYPRVRHTIVLAENDFGAPLMNNCGEMVGVSVHDTVGLLSAKLKLAETLSVATDLTSLVDFLTKNAVNFQQSDAVCPSESEKLAELEKAQKEQEEALEKTQEERKNAEAELDKLRKEAEQKQQELDEIEAEKQRQDEVLKQTEEERQEEKEKAEEALKEEQAKQQKLEEEKKAKEEELKEVEQQAKEKNTAQEQRLLFIGIVVVVVFIGVLIALYKRRKRIAEAEQEAEDSKAELSAQRRKLATAEDELQLASATFTDIVLVGVDESGAELRVKIIGDTLARTAGGLILGRSAQKANYVINEPTVSREHVKVSLSGKQVMVEDLNSANGTEVNGRSVTAGNSVEIKHDDELTLGTVVFKVVFLSK